MAYVDLNPIRAGIAATPEASEFTSIHERIQLIRGKKTSGSKLRGFHTQGSKSFSLPCGMQDYLHLVDWTGRAIRNDKRGHIDDRLPPILTRLNIDAAAWTQSMQPNGNVFGRAMGKLNHLHLHARTLGQSWIKGLPTSRTSLRLDLIHRRCIPLANNRWARLRPAPTTSPVVVRRTCATSPFTNLSTGTSNSVPLAFD